MGLPRRDERPGLGTEASKVARASDLLSIAPTRDTSADVLLPADIDLAIRRHIEAIADLLRPRCSRCSHPLTAPESIRLGMGPDCRRLVGGAR